MVFMESPLIHPALAYALTDGYLVFAHMMACKVFRVVALERRHDYPPSLMNSANMASALRSESVPPPATYIPTLLGAT